MKVRERPSLKALNTLGVDARAALLVTLENEEDVLAAPTFEPSRDVLLGGGSNVLFAADVPGTVFLNRISGIDTIDQDEAQALIEAGAGENWHSLVEWSLQRGYSGLENLSLIPGSVGAAPIQNIGAYGVELASVLDRVTAWDMTSAQWVTFDREACEFGYRDSRFRSRQPDRYLITSVRLRLSRKFRPQLAYEGLREELAGVETLSARAVSEAVIRLRQRKLPDPAEIGNAGSFFKNPIIDPDRASELRERFPALPGWPEPDGRVKLSAAWMIEHCGLKGYRAGDAGVSERHALVLVNHGQASGAEIVSLADKVRETVAGEFGIQLEPEPRIILFHP
jgi:UDP-N-acetylmuramate dehydrogenase